MTSVEHLVTNPNLSELANMMHKVRVAKPVFALGASLNREFLAPLAEKVNRVLISFNAFYKRKNKEVLGTVIFPYEFQSLPYSRNDSCKTCHLYDAGAMEIYKTSSDFLWHALSGTFLRKGKVMDGRFSNLRFSKAAVYIPESLHELELTKYARDYLSHAYLNIMALPLIAIQARILKRARAELYKDYQAQHYASLDPARADKSRIGGKYQELLKCAKDEYSIVVAFKDLALRLHTSAYLLRENRAGRLISNPYDSLLLSYLKSVKDSGRKQIKRAVEVTKLHTI